MLFRTILIKSQLIEFYGLDLFLVCVTCIYASVNKRSVNLTLT